MSALNDAEQLSLIGHDVTLFSKGKLPHADKYDFKYIEIDIPDKLTIRSFCTSSARNLRAQLARAKRENTTIIVHGLRSALLLVPNKCINLLIHGDGGYQGEAKAKVLLRKVLLKITPYLIKNSFTVSKPTNSRWTQVWVSSPNVDFLKCLKPPTPIDEQVLVWFGRIERPKRLDIFLELLKSARENGLNVRGEIWGPISSSSEFAKLDDFSNLHLDIHDGIFHPNEALFGDKIFCLFSDFEGRPFSTEEAICAGLPVLVSNLPGHVQMLGNDELLVTNLKDSLRALSNLSTFSDRRLAATRQRVALCNARNSIPEWKLTLVSLV